MPGIKLTLSGRADPALSERFAKNLTELTCAVLEKDPRRNTVTIDYVPHDQWFIAGTSLAALDRNSFRLEVTITEGTNTRDQKIAYQRQAFALLAELIGNVHPHSNVHVIDCSAVGYGYGGITQEWHYQHRNEGGAVHA
ncbi:MAG TPA: 4-oxalocrotonate tautomerase [Bordetella sp.]|uniref:tautomerase family protein n=1 Tax=Bordetella sp. TaxID=28081 RepID=UPI002ED21636